MLSTVGGTPGGIRKMKQKNRTANSYPPTPFEFQPSTSPALSESKGTDHLCENVKRHTYCASF